MTDYKWMWDVLKDEVKSMRQALIELEQEDNGLTQHGYGMLNAFEMIIKSMENWEGKTE